MIKLNFNNIPINYDEKYLYNKITKILKINKKEIKNIKIIKKSIDARKKPHIFYHISVAVELFNEKLENKLNYEKINLDYNGICFNKINSNKKIIVVGFGPSGMFCALALAKMGLNPMVFEQGDNVDERIKKVNDFWKKGKLDTLSNVQFGEGGAGTFSDGKLNTNLKSKICNQVINELYLHGAPEEILYENKPHIGSDKLCNVTKNIREDIISLGGSVKFNTKLVDIIIKDNNVKSIELLNTITNEKTKMECDFLCLCLGHSARDTFKILKQQNFNIKQKPFAIGLRLEQKAENVNKMQYGENYSKLLPNADYKLVTHLENGRSVFTFCMCPC